MREKLIDLVSDQADFLPWEIIEDIADHLIANGVTIQKWIPVTERLPEEVLEEIWDDKPHTASALVLVAVRDDCDRRFVSDDIQMRKQTTITTTAPTVGRRWMEGKMMDDMITNKELAKSEIKDMARELLANIKLVKILFDGVTPGWGDALIEVLQEELEKMKTKPDVEE